MLYGVLPEYIPYSPAHGCIPVWYKEVYSRFNGASRIFSRSYHNQYDDDLGFFLEEDSFKKKAERVLNLLQLERVLAKLSPYNFSKLYYAYRISKKMSESPKLIHVTNEISLAPFFRILHPRSTIIIHLQRRFVQRLDKYWGTFWTNRVLNQSDLVIGNSQSVVNDINNQFPSAEEKTTVVYNGVDVEMFTPTKKEKCDYDTKQNPTVLYAGRLDPEKGVHLLIDAMHDVVDEFGGAELMLIGAQKHDKELEGSYLQTLKKKSKPIEENISFEGHVTHEKMPKYYRMADLCVVPSTCREAFGVVIIEAMATALPTIVTNRGGPPEVVGDTGLVVDPEDVDELSKSIIEVINNPLRAFELGQQARERVKKKFSWSQVSRSFQHKLDNLIP